MPAANAPGGSDVGELGSCVRLPPLTANVATTPALLPFTNSVAPSGDRRRSTAPPPAIPNSVLPISDSSPSAAMAYRESVPEAVLVVNRNLPSWLISTQQGAVCPLANGDAAIEVRSPLRLTSNADTVPSPAPSWAFETNSWDGSVGRNSAPKGP